MLNKEISDKIKKLNYIYPFYQEWNQKKAIKKHVDYFGDTILVGQEYFRFKLSGDRGDDLKLSFCSMEKFLNILFITCPELESKAEKAFEKSFEEVRNIFDKLRK
jgi:hypothetical protein